MLTTPCPLWEEDPGATSKAHVKGARGGLDFSDLRDEPPSQPPPPWPLHLRCPLPSLRDASAPIPSSLRPSYSRGLLVSSHLVWPPLPEAPQHWGLVSPNSHPIPHPTPVRCQGPSGLWGESSLRGGGGRMYNACHHLSPHRTEPVPHTVGAHQGGRAPIGLPLHLPAGLGFLCDPEMRWFERLGSAVRGP